MGFFFSRIYRRKERNILFLGIDKSGKTSILHAILKITMKSPHQKLLTPTMGFNTDCVVIYDKKLLIWDLGGNENVRTYWHCYYGCVKGILFCIDQSDDERINLNLTILNELSDRPELKNCVFLIIYTKKDLHCSFDKEKTNKQISNILKNKNYRIFCTSIYDAVSIKEAFLWFTNSL